MTINYLEIVTPEVDSTCALYETISGLSFSSPDASMGQARLARGSDGVLVGVRAPLAEHEQPTVRSYIAVEDIHGAAKAAEARGATIAYPPTEQGEHGSFAIVIHDGVEHGLWQQ